MEPHNAYVDPSTIYLEHVGSNTTVFDGEGNMLYSKNSSGYEIWYKNDNIMHYKTNSGYEEWYDYDSRNNEIYYKNSDGFEYWSEYDLQNNEIYHRNTAGHEEWKEYDLDYGTLIYRGNSTGDSHWYTVTGDEITKSEFNKIYFI